MIPNTKPNINLKTTTNSRTWIFGLMEYHQLEIHGLFEKKNIDKLIAKLLPQLPIVVVHVVFKRITGWWGQI